MANAPAVRDKAKEIAQTIDRDEFRRQLEEALPANVSVDKFTRTTKLAVQLNPELVDVDRQSLFRAIVRCAADGLLPDGREAALVKVKVKGQDTASYWPMIGGLRKKAAEHGYAIEAHVVYANDEFSYELGFTPSVRHVRPGLADEHGEPIGAYAVGTGPDGRKYLEVMTREQIEQVRAVSRAATSEYGPWVKWWDRMACKTVARRLFGQLPLANVDERTERVIRSDAEIEEATAPVPELAGLPVVEPDADDYDAPEEE